MHPSIAVARRAVSLLAIACFCAPALADKSEQKAPKPSKKRHFALAYVPTAQLEAGTSPCAAMANRTIRVDSITDGREQPTRLGANLEEGDTPLPVTTESDAGAFVGEALEAQLRANGCLLATSDASRVISGQVVDLHVDLSGTYKARATLRILVKDAAGTELATIIGRGSATRFSMRESPENYLQALSDAVFEAVQVILKDPAFRSAL